MSTVEEKSYLEHLDLLGSLVAPAVLVIQLDLGCQATLLLHLVLGNQEVLQIEWTSITESKFVVTIFLGLFHLML